jgi:hypothetical protein
MLADHKDSIIQMKSLANRRRSVNSANRKELYPFAYYKSNNRKPLSVQTRSNTLSNLIKLYHNNQDTFNDEVVIKAKCFKTDFPHDRRKVSFRDKKITHALVDIENVESYKNHNLVNTHKVGASSTSLACCMIF